MSAAVQPVATLPTLPSSGPPPHNPLHHTPGGLALPPLGSAPVMMPRPPATTIPSLGPSLPPSHQDAADLAEAAPNQDVLLALLARNKNLEGKDSFHLFAPRARPPDPEEFRSSGSVFSLRKKRELGPRSKSGLEIDVRFEGFSSLFVLVPEYKQS
ncbi:hypothetical protein K0M31_003287 [Melipona bicolor]|uniref:Uncharacterized protein n=1 Tax=Melipona bicolor TaxID=60889 RepID=A0AA40FZL5_9HYME|nr:hypothetical protein K0M31_003287 [Melipona bicolor]